MDHTLGEKLTSAEEDELEEDELPRRRWRRRTKLVIDMSLE
jgi:hypothetical protein